MFTSSNALIVPVEGIPMASGVPTVILLTIVFPVAITLPYLVTDGVIVALPSKILSIISLLSLSKKEISQS